MKRHYGANLRIGLLLSVLLVTAGFRWLSFPDVVPKTPVARNEDFRFEVIPATVIKSPQWTPVIRHPAVANGSIEVPVDDPAVVEADTSVVVNISVPPVVLPVEEKPDPFIEFPETAPVLKGGEAFIRRHLEYPEVARMAKMQGLAVVTAYVDKTGKVVKTEILSDGGFEGFGTAAAEVIRKCEFEPAQQGGRAVPVRVNIPIRFKLR